MIIFALALRYLVARLRQSLLTIGGIVVGVTALTLVQSLMGGFRGEFVKRTLGAAPEIMVRRKPLEPFDPASPTRLALGTVRDPSLIAVARPPLPDEEEEIRSPEEFQRRIREVPGVVATAPLVAGQVMFGFAGNWEPVTVNGILPSRQTAVVDFASKVRQGRPEDLERDQNGVILGRYLAERLRIRVGDRVQARTPAGATVSLRVVALHDSMVYDTDNTSVWVNLRRAQALLGLGPAVNAIQVKTVHYEQANFVANRIQWATGMDAESWMEANRNTLGLLSMIITIQTLIGIFTMSVAGFGIAGNLITTVAEKTLDIGVLKAMGMTSARISMVFLTLAVLMTVIGVALGLGISSLAVDFIATLPSATRPQPGVLVATETIPMDRNPAIFLVSAAFAVVVSVLAGISPARRAAALEPLQIIRNAAG